MRDFLTALADYYDQGGLRPFRALISKAAMKAIAPKLGRQLASIDDRELLFLLRTMCGAKSAAEPFPYKSALKQAYMTNADWSPTALDVYLGEQLYLEGVYPADAAALNVEAHLKLICSGFRCPTFQKRMGEYVPTCASVAEFRSAAYAEAENMKIYAEFDKSKSRSSGKSLVTPAAPIKPPEVADTSKQGAPCKVFTAEEKTAHYLKKKAKEALEIDRSVAASLAARDSDQNKSFTAVVSAPPDPPPQSASIVMKLAILHGNAGANATFLFAKPHRNVSTKPLSVLTTSRCRTPVVSRGLLRLIKSLRPLTL